MKIKLKNGVVLPNNWKSCGCTVDDWKDLNSGKSIEVSAVPDLIKDSVDVVESASKTKDKKGDK
jgi:hypothetical protein|tara:strand:- start:165 stop:356 length:192 start_codon:yes stop_codon:yes gene_type:complete